MGTGHQRLWQRLLIADQLETQRGQCVICSEPLPEKGAVLNRFDGIGNFTPANVRAIHIDCEALVRRRRATGHTARQAGVM
jgi:hypothetical protein